uniref:Uncharacterized protein n=1 Tax=Candidatus Kentrum eta TaxID=2126337 RepID=A0A450VQ97_9GAMM|nr:MAG: hypothetical protein BECKH772B_GA0070898_103822 [Candidatus Kentron sp. H]VFK04250.1 MAG: hypothetical protein BECKH772A_GA0070896_103952 [Candidatus Kentron sp. H]VFK06935.1 MAG: hypothetical protein BECKH772C_GA0070978_103852 [Candidatus Kentron sp. H]
MIKIITVKETMIETEVTYMLAYGGKFFLIEHVKVIETPVYEYT